jgi:hypothetical protein
MPPSSPTLVQTVPALLDEVDRLQTFIERLWRAQKKMIDCES